MVAIPSSGCSLPTGRNPDEHSDRENRCPPGAQSADVAVCPVESATQAEALDQRENGDAVVA